jgi:hypothetical protein
MPSLRTMGDAWLMAARFERGLIIGPTSQDSGLTAQEIKEYNAICRVRVGHHEERARVTFAAALAESARQVGESFAFTNVGPLQGELSARDLYVKNLQDRLRGRKSA